MDFSFIIISNKEENINKCVDQIKNILKAKTISAEIIIAIGNNPSLQRNEASKKAKGDWLYFLDDDSILDAQSLEQFKIAKEKFPEAKVFGGPSLLRYGTISSWQQAVQLVFTSDIGVGPIKSRYLSFGTVRESGERELILCNMIVNRDYFMKSGGFNEALYPNEENEFLSRIEKEIQVVYSPLIIVYRYHRKNIALFFRQMINYGRGRTKHFLYSTNYSDYVYFIPLLLLIFFLGGLAVSSRLDIVLNIATIYLLIILPTCLINFFYKRRFIEFCMSIFAFIVCHVGYALGLFYGFVRWKKRPWPQIEVKVI